MSGNASHELFLEITDGTVRRAVEPETGTGDDGRSESVLVEDGVVVRADDLRSVRAALNGWMRLVSVADETRRVGR